MDLFPGPPFLAPADALAPHAAWVWPAEMVGLSCRSFAPSLAAFREELHHNRVPARSLVPLRIVMPTGRALSPSSRHPCFASGCRELWSPKKCSRERENHSRTDGSRCGLFSVLNCAVSLFVSWMSAARSSGSWVQGPPAREPSVPGFRLRLCASLPRASSSGRPMSYLFFFF